MYQLFLARCCALLLCAVCIPVASLAQCGINSSDGYRVTLSITPRTLIPDRNPCPYGYNYNVTLDYNISFTGSNRPASLYTLQGTISCGPHSLFYDLPNNGGSGSLTTGANPWTDDTDCATATVTSRGCNAVQIEINGPGIPAQFVPCTVTPLPVDLLSFQAEILQGNALLRWTTTREENNAFFAVERSEDGAAFTEMTRLSGAGTTFTEREYTWPDPAPVFGRTWYRLRQTDTDGSVHYSIIIEVASDLASRSLTLAPNPGSGQRVRISGYEPEMYAAEVLDLQGKGLIHVPSCSGELALPELLPGIYLIAFTHRETGETQTVRYCVE